ncbi:MAG: hypothetical protein ABRQ39_04910 [Candidatus Eremiobacterota bacterium]
MFIHSIAYGENSSVADESLKDYENLSSDELAKKGYEYWHTGDYNLYDIDKTEPVKWG